MHKEIYDFAVVNSLQSDKNRKTNKIEAYIMLAQDGTYQGLSVVEKKMQKAKPIPDLGSLLSSNTQANAIVEKAETILFRDSRKHPSYVKGISTRFEDSKSITAIHAFLTQLDTDDALYARITEDFNNSSLKIESKLSYNINGKPVEDNDDWYGWFDHYLSTLTKNDNQSEMIISSVSGKLQEKCPDSGAPAVVNAENKNAFGISTGAYVACAKYESFQSYGLQKTDTCQLGLEDAEYIKAGFEHLLSNPDHYDARFHCVFFYDKEVENIIKESLTLGSNVSDEDLEELEKDVGNHKGILHEILTAVQKSDDGRKEKRDFNADPEASYYMLGFKSKAQGRYYMSNETRGKYKDLVANLVSWYDDTCIFNGKNRKSVTNFYSILLNCVSLLSDNKSKLFEQVDKEFPVVQMLLLEAIYKNKQIPEILYRRALNRVAIDITKDDEDKRKRFEWDTYIKNIYAQIIKCYLIRKGYKIMPEVSNEVNVAYSCGKLFAVYEDLQYKYHHSCGRKSLVKPLSASYFNAALRRPGQTFTYLAEICNAYLNGVEPGVATFYSSMIGKLSEEIGTAFPTSFNSDETGSFALGYYQQKAAFIKNRRKDRNEDTYEETDEETNE